MSRPKVIMVQLFPNNWYLMVSHNGVILQKDITVSSTYQAEEFVTRYISSFPNWEYEIRALDKKDKVK
jgi:hypothetical protein